MEKEKKICNEGGNRAAAMLFQTVFVDSVLAFLSSATSVGSADLSGRDGRYQPDFRHKHQHIDKSGKS